MSDTQTDSQKKLLALAPKLNNHDWCQAAIDLKVSYKTIERYMTGRSYKESFGIVLLPYMQKRISKRNKNTETAAA